MSIEKTGVRSQKSGGFALWGLLLTVGILQGQPAAAPPKPAPAKATATAIPSYKDLKYPPLKDVKIPVPVQVTLSNGMRVFLLEDHELPVLRGLALVRTGNLFDPADKRGLSQVMAEVMRSGGTKTKTGDQIDEELENIAASVESGMDEASASVSFSGLKEASDTVLATFKDVLTNPEFRQDKIDLSLTQLRGGILRKNDDADGIPGRELQSILYGRDTAYGAQIELEHLGNIRRADLVAFYQRYYFPKNIMLGVYGDFNSAEMKDRLEKLFADWKVQQPDVPPFPKVDAKAAPGVYFGEKTDVTQTFFAMGHLGGVLLDKDYAALQVAANILGEGFSSRLVSQIRTKLGYAYGISASWAANYDHPGVFEIAGSTKSGSTVAALQVARVELEKMRTAEVTERELTEAKQAVQNSFVFAFDSPAKTLSRVMRYEYYGYPKDFLFQYQKAAAAVTRADVLRVAKERFRPEQMILVAVGNPAQFDKPLSTLGPVTALDLTIKEPRQEVAASSEASLARGRQLLARAQQAMGGADKLAAVKDFTQTLDLNMAQGPGGGMKMKQVNRYLAPDQFRQEQEAPFGKISAYTDGKSGWMALPQGVMPMPAEVLKQAQGELFRTLVPLMLSDRTGARQVNATSDNSVEISGAGQTVKVDFDASGVPSKLTYQEGAMTATESYSDWRETGGLKMPFKVLIEQNGNKVAEGSVSEYRFNAGLTAEELNRKP